MNEYGKFIGSDVGLMYQNEEACRIEDALQKNIKGKHDKGHHEGKASEVRRREATVFDIKQNSPVKVKNVPTDGRRG